MLCFGLVQAQTYNPVTALSGNQVVGGVTVNVVQSNPAPNTATTCGTGPYQIGRLYSDWYQYNFTNTSITHARIRMIRIHDDDTVRISVNGSQYNLTPANLSPYAGGSCALTSNTTTAGGLLSTTSGAVGPGQGVEIVIQMPGTMSNIRVEHIRDAANVIASDVIYSLEIANDSCALEFTAVADTPVCSGRDVQFSVTQYPNTTYSWTTTAPLAPTWAPSANVRNPVALNMNVANSGVYTVTGTRGACNYSSSVNVTVAQSPTFTGSSQDGPVCPHEDDTIRVSNVALPSGGFVVTYGVPLGGVQDTFDPNINYALRIPDMTKAKSGYYQIYAVGLQGCVSDTDTLYVDIFDSVKADFSFEIKEDCEIDSVQFTDLSISARPITSQYWEFDNSVTPPPTSTDKNPLHLYPTVPKDEERKYGVILVASNGQCDDTTYQELTINHPIKAWYSVIDDSICQGTKVEFLEAEDSSLVKPGTLPTVRWIFGNGASDSSNQFNMEYTYEYAGRYNSMLIIKDVLGCADTHMIEIVVDSLGFVDFTTDKESVCVGEEIKLSGIFSEYGYTSAVLDMGDGVVFQDSTEIVHSYNIPGTYDINFDLDYRICPPASKSGQIVVKPIPQIYLGEDTAICPNDDAIYIEDLYVGNNPSNVTYSWNTPTADVTPGIYVYHHGTYSVLADMDGCTATDTIVVKKNCYINIPSAFTPNGDGRSDYFPPRQTLSRNVSAFEMSIYNRWGEKIFETNSIDGRGWDGKYGGDDQPVGVYLYSMRVTFGNGYTENYQGNVTLIR